MENSDLENNEDIYDEDSDSEVPLLEYIEETNKFVAPSGKVKNQYLFEDTAKVFGAITKNEIELSFDDKMKIRTRKGEVIETALIKDIDRDGKYKITIPVNSALADNEQDILSYFLMKPLAQVFAKTDARNLAILLADNRRLKQSEEAVTEIWKTVEAHRIESFYNKLRLGTYADIQRLNKKSFDNRKIDNIIDAVKAIHAKREELIPPKYADLIEPVKTLLSRVERSDPTATNIITKKIFDIIEQELTKEQQRQDEAQSKKEEKAKQKRQKEAQEAPTEQQLPTDQELEAEVQAEAQQSQGNSQPSQDENQNNLDNFLNQSETLEDKINEQLKKAAIKSSRKDVKDQNFTKIDIDTETMESGNSLSDTTTDEKIEEMLDQSKQKGEDMIDKLSEKLTKVEQKTDTGKINTDLYEIDIDLTTEDHLGSTRAEKTYDVTLSRQLRHMFQNMRTKFRNIRSDSSGTMNIKRTIQYMAGDREAKIYDRNIRQTGINIRFVVDCSTSMGSEVNDKYDPTTYYHRKSKMSASKELLITMLEATKGLEEYIDLKILAYGSMGSVPTIDRKRVETLYCSGATPTDYGIRQAHLDLKKCKQGQKLIIHLTDGEPNDQESARDAIRAAEKDGIKIFTVMLPNSEKLDHKEYKRLEYIFGKGKFEPIFQWSTARRTMTNKIANSITSMLQGY